MTGLTCDTCSVSPPDVYRERLARAATLTGAAGLDGIVVSRPGSAVSHRISPTPSNGSPHWSSRHRGLRAWWWPGSNWPRSPSPPSPTWGSRSPTGSTARTRTRSHWTRLPADPAIAVSDVMPALHVIPLAERTGRTPALATAVLRELRMIKDPAEVEALRAAGAAIDRVHARMGEWLKPGRTEREVADDIRQAIVAEGHTGAEFIIVGQDPPPTRTTSSPTG